MNKPYCRIECWVRFWDDGLKNIDMILDLFIFKNLENPSEVDKEEIQPDMTICPKVVYYNVTDSILDITGNEPSGSTSGQLSETIFAGANHQITGYLFSDYIFSNKKFDANFYWVVLIVQTKFLYCIQILVVMLNFDFYHFSKQFLFKLM